MTTQEFVEYNEEMNDEEEYSILPIYSNPNFQLVGECINLPEHEFTSDDGELLENFTMQLDKIQSSKSCETIITTDDNKSSTSKSSDSLICLVELKVSDLKLNILSDEYPIPEDPGLVPGFWILYPRPPDYDVDGIEKFINLTHRMKLCPIQKILDMLKTDELNLRYYGLDSRIVRPICEALFNNPFVKILDLTDNWLSVDACFHLDELLTNNQVLTHLNLSGCRIGARGAKRLEAGIGAAPSLKYLNVSRCDLDDEGFKYISIGVYYSSTLEIIDFSRNNLGDNTADNFQTMLVQADTLKKLNLDWNELYSAEFWKKFVDGLTRNNSLEEISLAWNSLGLECLPYLQRYLTSPTNLLRLTIKNNNFNQEAGDKIGKSLVKNKTLEILDLGNNPLTTDGVFNLVNNLKNILAHSSKLKLIDLHNIWANKNIEPLLNKIRERLPQLTIKLGGIFSNYKLTGPDPRKIYLKRANFEAQKPKKKIQKRDFGQFIMSLENAIVTKEFFENAIKRHKIKLSQPLITEIINVFEIGRDAIDQSALKAFYLKEYPDIRPAPPAQEKKKKTKKSIKKKGTK